MKWHKYLPLTALLVIAVGTGFYAQRNWVAPNTTGFIP